MAQERFDNELKVLKVLEKNECPFVPRALDSDPDKLYLVTTNCGKPVDQISEKRMRQLFFELEQYGVRHNDPYPRNVTYDPLKGRFCLIDFEFATILTTGEGLTLKDTEGKGKEV